MSINKNVNNSIDNTQSKKNIYQEKVAFQNIGSYPQEEMFNQDVLERYSYYDSFDSQEDFTTQNTMKHQNYSQNINILDDPNIMKSDLLAVLSTPQGRRFLRRLFRSCGVFDYIPITDQSLYAWHEGRRSIGLIVYHSVFELGANFINQLLTEDRNNI